MVKFCQEELCLIIIITFTKNCCHYYCSFGCYNDHILTLLYVFGFALLFRDCQDLSIYLSIYLSVCLSVCLSLYLSIYLSISFQENLEVTSLRPWTNQLKLAICIIRKSPKIVWIASRYWKLLLFLLKVNNRNTRTSGEICSKLTIRTLG